MNLLILTLSLCAPDPQLPPPRPPMDTRIVMLEQEMIAVKERLDKLEQSVQPKVQTAQPVASTVVPNGMHAHQRTDGSIIIHSDSNRGSAAAHAGIERPWPKVAVAGQVVSCPNGVCPTQAVSYGTASYASASYSENSKPKKRLFSGLFKGKVCRGGNCP